MTKAFSLFGVRFSINVGVPDGCQSTRHRSGSGLLVGRAPELGHHTDDQLVTQLTR